MLSHRAKLDWRYKNTQYNNISCSNPDQLARLHDWLGAATILPPKHIYDPDSPCVFDPDIYSTFRPKCTRYNPLESPGSYVLISNGATGAKDKVAIFTKNDAIVLNADSYEEAIILFWPYATERRLTKPTKLTVYKFSDMTCLYLFRHISAHYSHTRSRHLQLNISMDSMAAILSLVSIDYWTHLTSRTIHVSKLLSVTVCFYLNHPVTHWWLAPNTVTTPRGTMNTPTYRVHPTHEYTHHTKWTHTLANDYSTLSQSVQSLYMKMSMPLPANRDILVCDGTNITLLELTTQIKTQQLPEAYVKVVHSAVLISILLISIMLNRLSHTTLVNSSLSTHSHIIVLDPQYSSMLTSSQISHLVEFIRSSSSPSL